MADTVRFTIDGRSVEAPAGTTILEAAKSVNILIPNLCHNEELAPYGACRMCMVETTHKKRTKLVVSCIAEASEGLEVKTDTERVRNVRTLVMHLLLARNPNHPVLRKWRRRSGSRKRVSRWISRDASCAGNACASAARSLASPRSASNRGGRRERSPRRSTKLPPPASRAARATTCVPSGVISMEEHDGVRTIWKTEFAMAKCSKCGKYFAPVKQLEYFRKIANLPADHFDTCIDCRSTKK